MNRTSSRSSKSVDRTAEHAAETTRLAIEIFGGIGFMEDYAISRLHREALVTAIWEGTSNIQALDMLEAMHKKGAHEAFLDEFLPLLQQYNTREAHLALRSIETTINVLGDLNPERAQWYSKEALARLADAGQVALLYSFAEILGERYAKVAQLYARRFLAGEPYPDWALNDQEVWWPFAEHLMIPPDEKSVTSASRAG